MCDFPPPKTISLLCEEKSECYSFMNLSLQAINWINELNDSFRFMNQWFKERINSNFHFLQNMILYVAFASFWVVLKKTICLIHKCNHYTAAQRPKSVAKMQIFTEPFSPDILNATTDILVGEWIFVAPSFTYNIKAHHILSKLLMLLFLRSFSIGCEKKPDLFTQGQFAHPSIVLQNIHHSCVHLIGMETIKAASS